MCVLVVEDEPPIADFLVRALREEGYVVEHAADGPSGTHALRSGEWDAVLRFIQVTRTLSCPQRLNKDAANRRDVVLSLQTRGHGAPNLQRIRRYVPRQMVTRYRFGGRARFIRMSQILFVAK